MKCCPPGRTPDPLVALPGAELRPRAGRLHAMPPLPAFDPAQRLPWDGLAPLSVPGVGTLHMHPPGALGPCEVRLRQGGERFHPAGRPHSQSLKKLLQGVDAPPWWRERWPLIYRGDALVAVPGLGLAAGEGGENVSVSWSMGVAGTSAVPSERRVVLGEG